MLHRYLQDIVYAYNHTRHISIKMQPAIVTWENARIVRENMKHRNWNDDDKENKKKKMRGRKQKIKYNIDDLVRRSVEQK